MDEIWKPIPGYDSRYEVSNHGRVRSFVTGTGSKGAVHYLKQDGCTKYGHRRVTLSMGRVTKRFMVHRLVAEQFIGESPTDAHMVNHIDFNPSNNRADNLEWVTMQGNHDHSIARHPRGISHGMNRLSEDQVREIRKLHAAGVTTIALGKQFSISQAHAHRIVSRQSWGHLK
jgi:hypothetical protein